MPPILPAIWYITIDIHVNYMRVRSYIADTQVPHNKGALEEAVQLIPQNCVQEIVLSHPLLDH